MKSAIKKLIPCWRLLLVLTISVILVLPLSAKAGQTGSRFSTLSNSPQYKTEHPQSIQTDNRLISQPKIHLLDVLPAGDYIYPVTARDFRVTTTFRARVTTTGNVSALTGPADGNLFTIRTTELNPGSYAHWEFVLDFGKVYSGEEIHLSVYGQGQRLSGDGDLRNQYISVSEDGINWRGAGRNWMCGVNCPLAWNVDASLGEQTFRYIRLRTTFHHGTHEVGLDAVRVWNQVPVTVELYDLDGNVVDHLTRNSEGWPSPNPLEMRVSAHNITGQSLSTPYLDLSIVNPDNLAERRFYVIEGQGTYHSVLPRYDEVKPLGALLPDQTEVISTLVWIQPSMTSTLMFSADMYTDTASLAPFGDGNKEAAIDIAEIHPLVLVPGFLATYPPVHGGELDPFTKTFSNTIAALARAGYTPGGTNSGATLIPFGYDWRRPISETGRFTLKSDIQSITNTFPILRKPYVDYSQVDLLAHSMGGLVSRAYIEDAIANNENTVHKLVTLATPHQGTLAAYRGWYGGDPGGILPNPADFKGILGALAVCKLQDMYHGQPVPSIREAEFLLASQYYQYFRAEVPSAQDMLPPASYSSVPAYLVSPTSTITYPYPGPPPSPPPSLFLEDLNTPGGLFDVAKLQAMPITSSFSLAWNNEGVYRVDPPPTPVDPAAPEMWLYGQRNKDNVINVPGDIVVPNFSGNLKLVPTVSSYSNIYGHDVTGLGDAPIQHTTIPNDPGAVRQILSYMTGIANIPVAFWNVPHNPTPEENYQKVLFKSCSMVRLQVTDPQGRRAGLDLTTGQVINEIPGAFVSAAGIVPQLIILPEIAGQYDVQGIGTGAGFYAMGALHITEADNPLVLRMLTGTATMGAPYSFTVTPIEPPRLIYMPVIFKNSTGQALAVPAPVQVIEEVFVSPIPTPTPQPVVIIESLSTGLDAAYQQGQITNEGVYRSLGNKLSQAQKHLNESKTEKAVKKLEAFIDQVGKQQGKRIAPESAGQLIGLAQQLIVQLRQ